MSAAVDQYVTAMRLKRAASTCDTLEYRLAAILDTAGRDRPLRLLSASVARGLFARRAEQSGDTQVGELAAARGFAAWCVGQGWLRADPFAGLEPTKRKKRGKPQLRIDEARRLLDACLEDGTLAGLGTAIALLMGLRVSEIVDRVVRDVDDSARVLWIDKAKTKAGQRALEVPSVLRPWLAEITKGQPAGERIFGSRDRHWLGYHARRLCGVAKVPIVPPHGLRGTWSSLAAEAVPVEAVAAALGHVGPAITRRHYLADGAERGRQQATTLRVLAGGRK